MAKVLDYGPVAVGHTGKRCTYSTNLRKAHEPHPQCTDIATFAITVYGEEEAKELLCGRHLTPGTREIIDVADKALITQVIPIRVKRKYR